MFPTGGTLLVNNVPTPYDPALLGAPKWVLGARTGDANDNHWIDDLCTYTVITPANAPALTVALVFGNGISGNGAGGSTIAGGGIGRNPIEGVS